MEALDDTIVARGTPPGQGAVAVIRISGPDAAKLLSRVTRTTGSDPLAEPRRLRLLGGPVLPADREVRGQVRRRVAGACGIGPELRPIIRHLSSSGRADGKVSDEADRE